MDDGKAFQQLIQRLAKVLARALVGYNFFSQFKSVSSGVERVMYEGEKFR